MLAGPRLAFLATRRRYRECAAAATLLAGFLALTMEWPRLGAPEPRAQDGMLRLRLISWNVAGAVPLDALEAHAPDLCLLQEIGPVAAQQLRGFWTGWHWQEALDPGLLSRHPLARLPTRKIGPWTEPQVARVDLPSGRRLIVVNVRLMLPALVVAAASFERPSLSILTEAHRQRLGQFTGLEALIRETMGREGVRSAILCGDFNTPGGVGSLDPLRGVLFDVWPAAGRGWGATMTADLPVSRIDQCWTTPDIRPVRARVVRGPSDHRALVVDVEM